MKIKPIRGPQPSVGSQTLPPALYLNRLCLPNHFSSIFFLWCHSLSATSKGSTPCLRNSFETAVVRYSPYDPSQEPRPRSPLCGARDVVGRRGQVQEIHCLVALEEVGVVPGQAKNNQRTQGEGGPSVRPRQAQGKGRLTGQAK